MQLGVRKKFRCPAVFHYTECGFLILLVDNKQASEGFSRNFYVI